jgi:hypothetical protein
VLYMGLGRDALYRLYIYSKPQKQQFFVGLGLYS